MEGGKEEGKDGLSIDGAGSSLSTMSLLGLECMWRVASEGEEAPIVDVIGA